MAKIHQRQPYSSDGEIAEIAAPAYAADVVAVVIDDVEETAAVDADDVKNQTLPTARHIVHERLRARRPLFL